MLSVAIEHAYSPEQYAKTVELWERLITAVGGGLSEDRETHSWPIQELADEHLYALVLSDGAGTPGYSEGAGKAGFYPVTLTLISYSDGGGSDFDAANVRYLAEIEQPGVNTSTNGRRGEGSASIQVGELPHGGGSIDDAIEWLEDLVNMIEGLSGYPLISEASHGEYVDELAEEAWDAYLRSDVRSELETALGCDDLDDFGFSDGEIRELYYGQEHNEWRCETATSVVNDYHDDTVSDIANTIIRAWVNPAVHPDQLFLFAS